MPRQQGGRGGRGESRAAGRVSTCGVREREPGWGRPGGPVGRVVPVLHAVDQGAAAVVSHPLDRAHLPGGASGVGQGLSVGKSRRQQDHHQGEGDADHPPPGAARPAALQPGLGPRRGLCRRLNSPRFVHTHTGANSARCPVNRGRTHAHPAVVTPTATAAITTPAPMSWPWCT